MEKDQDPLFPVVLVQFCTCPGPIPGSANKPFQNAVTLYALSPTDITWLDAVKNGSDTYHEAAETRAEEESDAMQTTKPVVKQDPEDSDPREPTPQLATWSVATSLGFKGRVSRLLYTYRQRDRFVCGIFNFLKHGVNHR